MDWKITSINTANHEVSITFEDGEVIDTVIPLTHKTMALKQKHILDTVSKAKRRKHVRKAGKIFKYAAPISVIGLLIYIMSLHHV